MLKPKTWQNKIETLACFGNSIFCSAVSPSKAFTAELKYNIKRMMARNNGKFLEQIVHAIEQLIAPDAVVEQNVELPILSSKSGCTAQCDIVIRSGKKPRETITIIEVQDRSKAVDINDFRGWVQKLEDVGAQHLYCVSRNPFPESIKEKVALSGNTIKLITLKELEPGQIPSNFFDFSFRYNDFDVMAIQKRETIFSETDLSSYGITPMEINNDITSLRTNDLKFSTDKKNFKALSTLCLHCVDDSVDVPSQISSGAFGYDDNQPLFYFYNNNFIRIKLKVEYTWKLKKVIVPISFISYDQNEHGALAWVLEAFYNSSKGPIWFKLPVVKNGSEFTIKGIFLTLPEGMEASLTLTKKSTGSSID